LPSVAAAALALRAAVVVLAIRVFAASLPLGVADAGLPLRATGVALPLTGVDVLRLRRSAKTARPDGPGAFSTGRRGSFDIGCCFVLGGFVDGAAAIGFPTAPRAVFLGVVVFFLLFEAIVVLGFAFRWT